MTEFVIRATVPTIGPRHLLRAVALECPDDAKIGYSLNDIDHVEVNPAWGAVLVVQKNGDSVRYWIADINKIDGIIGVVALL